MSVQVLVKGMDPALLCGGRAAFQALHTASSLPTPLPRGTISLTCDRVDEALTSRRVS